MESIKEVDCMIPLEQNSHTNLMIKRSKSGLSRLVQCAGCKSCIEWPVADEEGVRNAAAAEGVLDAETLKKCVGCEKCDRVRAARAAPSFSTGTRRISRQTQRGMARRHLQAPQFVPGGARKSRRASRHLQAPQIVPGGARKSPRASRHLQAPQIVSGGPPDTSRHPKSCLEVLTSRPGPPDTSRQPKGLQA